MSNEPIRAKVARVLNSTDHHGTSVAAARSIESIGFIPSVNPYDWLGSGIYFFLNGPTRARSWAKKIHGDQWAVIEVKLNLKHGLLDLNDDATHAHYSQVVDEVIRRADEILAKELLNLRPLLVQRKTLFKTYDRNIVGERIRRLRQEQGISRSELAAASSRWYPITEAELLTLEESTDRAANPSLLQLREIATLLKTTVAELVEPDLAERDFEFADLIKSITSRRNGRSRMSDDDINRTIAHLKELLSKRMKD